MRPWDELRKGIEAAEATGRKEALKWLYLSVARAYDLSEHAKSCVHDLLAECEEALVVHIEPGEEEQP